MPRSKKNNTGTGPSRVRGAKRRAVRALIGRKQSEAMSPAELFSFWSAANNRIAPPLRTSFGNFTTLNSVCRFTVTTSTTLDWYVWVPWTPGPVAALATDSGSNPNVLQHLYGTLTSSSPLCIRPLRMSVSVECITQQVNVAGSMRTYAYDNAIVSSWQLDATGSNPVKWPSGNAPAFLSLISSAPDTEEVTLASLTTEREFVSAPSSYPGYNSYYDFEQFTGTTTGVAMRSDDAQLLLQGQSDELITVPSTFVTGKSGAGSLGGVPPMRGFIFLVPATASGVQTLRFAVHRQDGARYPVNTLGATFAQVPKKMPAQNEDVFLRLAEQVARAPSASVPRAAVSNSDWGVKVNDALANVKSMVETAGNIKLAVDTARPLLARALPYIEEAAMFLPK